MLGPLHCVRGLHCKFCSKCHTLSNSAIFWKLVKIWQTYRQFKGGNFFRYSVDSQKVVHVFDMYLPVKFEEHDYGHHSSFTVNFWLNYLCLCKLFILIISWNTIDSFAAEFLNCLCVTINNHLYVSTSCCKNQQPSQINCNGQISTPCGSKTHERISIKHGIYRPNCAVGITTHACGAATT